jgi:hypothetical protein
MGYTRDASGKKRRWIIVRAHNIRTEKFYIAQKDLDYGIPFQLHLEEYCQLNKKERREKYNNLFENFVLEKKRAKENRKRR